MKMGVLMLSAVIRPLRVIYVLFSNRATRPAKSDHDESDHDESDNDE